MDRRKIVLSVKIESRGWNLFDKYDGFEVDRVQSAGNATCTLSVKRPGIDGKGFESAQSYICNETFKRPVRVETCR